MDNQQVSETLNMAEREISEFARIYDGINAALLRLTQEGQKKSLLTAEHGSAILSLSEALSTKKANLQDMASCLKDTKQKALQSETTTNMQEYFTKAVDKAQKERQKKRNSGNDEGDDDNEVTGRLKSILNAANGGQQKRAKETALDEVGNVSLVLDEVNSHLSEKCPITLLPIVNPYRNEHCKHVFEKEAVLNYIRTKKRNGGTIVCPHLGCRNKTHFTEKHFEIDHTFRRATTQQF